MAMNFQHKETFPNHEYTQLSSVFSIYDCDRVVGWVWGLG
jgi:hypothetical protein